LTRINEFVKLYIKYSFVKRGDIISENCYRM
jgi:hypothetical protein